MKEGVSIIVCCYNSATRLPDTMKHIACQKVEENIRWEVIIVNNASTDNTQSISENFKLANPKLNISIVNETEPGLSHARLKGVKEANHELIVFCDDDVWLEENYVNNAVEIMQSNLEIGVLGGRGEAVSDEVLPYWFSTYQGGFACGVQALESGDVTGRGYVWGAGMVLRKSIFQDLMKCGFYFHCSGRKDGKLLAGDDSEICKWFVLAGYKLWYNETLQYKHFMPSNRLTIEHFKGLQKGFKASAEFLGKYDLVINHLKKNYSSRSKIRTTFKLYVIYLLGRISKNILKQKLQLLYPKNQIFASESICFKIYTSTLCFLNNNKK